MFDSTFNHNKFRSLIDSSGLSNAELSKKIGIDTSLINRHYNGDKNRPISVYYLEKYCKYFDVTPNYFYDLENEKLLDRELLSVVCEYTGLNENSANFLHTLAEVRNYVEKQDKTDKTFWGKINDESNIKPKKVFEISDYSNPPKTALVYDEQNLIRITSCCIEAVNLLLEEDNAKNIIYEIGRLSNNLIISSDREDVLYGGLYKLNMSLSKIVEQRAEESTAKFFEIAKVDRQKFIYDLTE